ncbi:MAG: protein kinase [Planctomycetota bacterium]
MTFAQPFTDYEILDRVGAGAMGTVFKARHKRLNRIVALKVLKPSLARDTRYVDRLRREARIVASLSHPNIVTGYDLGEEAGYHFFVMEFVEGKSLRAMLAEWGMFGEEFVTKVARQVTQALDHAWQRGVIHRDIKPGNILIDEAGNVKLTDMGLAKGPTDLTLTRDGATVGTPQYISPEQARNPHDVDVRTDLYSLGATLYHMATGVPPFRGDTMAELITAVLHELPVSPNAINSSLSDGMSLVIRKLLAKDLTVRYQNPRALLDDLDRLERALPPQIDPARLSAGEGEPARWWPRVLLALAAAALLATAWWIGVQMQPAIGSQPTASEFLQALDAELAALPTPGARHARVHTITVVPPGSEGELAQRKRQAEVELQAAVDRVVDEFTGERGAALSAWLRDPTIWPDSARAERDRLQPRLLAVAGVALAQLPATVRLQRLQDLRQQIVRLLDERDGELVERFGSFLATRLPELAAERLRASDFAGAERTWREGLTTFCDGVRVPAHERLAARTRALLEERHGRAQADARPRVDAAERQVAEALKAEVTAVCDSLAERLRDTAPEQVEQELRRFQKALEHDWPAAGCFRAGSNPWPDLERRFGVLDSAIRVAIAERDEQRFAGRLDLVWRVFCHGRPADAEALLAGIAEPGSERAERAERHRRALAAAGAVEAAMVQEIARRTQPTVAFLRSGGAEALELRAESEGSRWRLVGHVVQQPGRVVQLGELRFSQLLARLHQERDPLTALAPAERIVGTAVFRLLGDDLDGIADLLAALDPAERRFLEGEVWPRVLRVRGEKVDAPLDREGLFARVRSAVAAASRGGVLDDLAQALFAASNHVPDQERTPAEAKELRRAESWLQLERRRRTLAAELLKSAPDGAAVAVRIDGETLAADVELPAKALQRDAAEGWHVQGDTIEFADGGRPWSEHALKMLRGDPGLAATVGRTSLLVDLLLPGPAVGRRFWVFEFRGVAVVLVLAGNDTVHAALVDGDLKVEANVAAAFVRALSGVMEPARVVAVPGGVHRLAIEVAADTQRTHAAVRVLFEGHELVPRERRALDPDREPTFAVHPQQDLVVQRIIVRGEGL